jgi:hypothetical protein
MGRKLNAAEERAIRDLRALAKRWPDSLTLFSWNGSLVVLDGLMESSDAAILESIEGIPNDGGDPS